MASQSSEQLVHDRINLNRLVRRLEKAIADEDWNEDSQLPPRATWIKTRTTLQVGPRPGLRHARDPMLQPNDLKRLVISLIGLAYLCWPLNASLRQLIWVIETKARTETAP